MAIHIPVFSTGMHPRFAARINHKKITFSPLGQPNIPDHVRIPFIEGDGIGPEVMAATQRLVNEAVKQAYADRRSIQWVPMMAGEKALSLGKPMIPPETRNTIKRHYYFIKGPVATPIGKGFRSINVQLRQMFDLYACIRPIKFLQGVVTPMKQDKTDIVIFRENTEDVYAGIEFAQDSPEAKAVTKALKKLKAPIADRSAVGIKPISEAASKRLIARAIQYALDHNRPSVTLVHKGNIMKFTEGAFAQWGEEVAREQFKERVILFDDFVKTYQGDYARLRDSQGNIKKVVLQSRLTDAMFQDVILNPQLHSVIATTNLNGDLLSDAVAATVGGLGVSPGANIGDKYAMFESTHGTAPDIAGQNKANPSALFLTSAMMLEHMGWDEAAQLIRDSVETCFQHRRMTGDLARHIPDTPGLSTTAFTEAVIETMRQKRAQSLPRYA